MKRILLFLFTVTISLALSAVDLVIAPFDLSKATSSQLLASQIYSAAFNDISPGFDDLYVIKTQDKGREIIIYCNAT
jgi:ABC-type sugar transport system permease subunit